MPKITIKKRHVIRKSQITELLNLLADEIGQSADLFRSDRIERVDCISQGGQCCRYIIRSASES